MKPDKTKKEGKKLPGTKLESNLSYEVREDGLLCIYVDPKKRLGPSASGKTILIASSKGNVALDEIDSDMKLGFNLYVPA